MMFPTVILSKGNLWHYNWASCDECPRNHALVAIDDPLKPLSTYFYWFACPCSSLLSALPMSESSPVKHQGKYALYAQQQSLLQSFAKFSNVMSRNRWPSKVHVHVCWIRSCC